MKEKEQKNKQNKTLKIEPKLARFNVAINVVGFLLSYFGFIMIEQPERAC